MKNPTPTRRQFIKETLLAGAGALLATRAWAIPSNQTPGAKAVRFGIISDLHHQQFGDKDNQLPRLKAFLGAALKVSPDFIIQNGDFCNRPKAVPDLMAEWNRFPGPKYHVLGNHDMDLCDKAAIMKLWGLERPYYSFDQGGYHFIVLDRNFIHHDDGTFTDYATGNWYKSPGAQISFTDSAQLAWLRKDLAAAKTPVVVFMHQPVFVTDFFNDIGNAKEILAVFDEANYAATKTGTNSRVIAVFMGHDHDDRHGERNGVHYITINSATYAYQDGAFFYQDPLFAFVTLDPAGRLAIEGRSTTYRDGTPDSIKAVFPAKISNREFQMQ